MLIGIIRWTTKEYAGYSTSATAPPAAKRLNEEVERLVADLHKLNTEFGAKGGDPQKYIDTQNKLRESIDRTREAAEKLSGGGGGGADAFEMVNRKLFALERGMTNLVGGTGLGRAGGLLESGIALFGGPAGLGFAIAMFANTLDNVLPKLEGFWAHLWNQLTADEVQEKLKSLAEEGKKAKESLDSVFARSAPGHEAVQARLTSALQSVFNAQTQREGLEQGVQGVLRQRGLMGHAEETSEVQALHRQQRDIRGSTEFPDDPHIQSLIQGLENQIRQITQDNVLRRASELLLNAQKEGPEGKRVQKS